MHPRTLATTLLVCATLASMVACGGTGSGAAADASSDAAGADTAGGDATGGDAPYLSPLPTASLILDFDQDGDQDIIVGDALVDVVLVNDGQGGFVYRADLLPEHYLGKDGSTVSLSAGDFNVDGVPDIVAVTVDVRGASFYATSRIHIWLGDGAGGFTDGSAQVADASFVGWPDWVRVGDFDGDGADDFLITQPGCGWEETCFGGTIYLNDGSGSLAPATVTSTDAERTYTGSMLLWESDGNVQSGEGSLRHALDVFVGDVDNDGRLDLVAPGSAEGAMATFINRSTPGELTFDLVYTVDPADPFSGLVAMIKNGALLDIDGDGFLDVVGSTAISRTQEPEALVHAFINRGDGSFAQSDAVFLPAQPGVEHARQWLTADFDGDGTDDLLVADHGYDHDPFPGQPNLLLLNNGAGALVDMSAQNLSNANTYTHGAAVGDVNGDGFPDLFLNNTSNVDNAFLNPESAVPEARLWLGNGDGSFRPEPLKLK